MKKIFMVLFSGLFLFIGAVCGYAKELKMAYVDLDKVFEEYSKTKETYKSLDGKLNNKEAERKKMVDEIKRLKDELELMSDKGKEEKQVVIEEKINALNEFTRKAELEFKKERFSAIRDISDAIAAFMQDYAKSEGYDYLFSSRAFAFAKDEYDITNAVIKKLNEKTGVEKKQKGNE